MKKSLLTLFLAGCVAMVQAGSNVTYTTDVTRDVTKTTNAPTLMRVSTNAIVDVLAVQSEAALERGLKDGSVQFLAKQGSGTATTATKSYGSYGYWFTKSGYVCTSSNDNRRVACKYEDGYFHIVHNTGTDSKGSALIKTGDTFTLTEMFVQGEDTVQYVFHVALGSTESIESDQPDYVETLDHRTDEIERWPLQPLMRQNDGEWLAQNYIQVMAGDKVSFRCADKGDNTFVRIKVDNKAGKNVLRYTSDSSAEFTIDDAQPADAGYYVCTTRHTNTATGKTYTETHRFYVDVQTQPLGAFWDWTGEVPQLSYDFHTEYGNLPAPTKVHNIRKKDGTKANQYVGEWWSVFWGDNLNSAVGGQEKAMDAAQNMVKKYDEDFQYIYDNIGWPPNLSARKGYRSMIYIFGSGLANDDTPNTEQGGYQSATSADGGTYACVWASYYPFSRFRSDADKLWNDGEYQREAMVHEGIHTLFADLNHCRKSSWFHEGGNVWLQQELHVRRDNSYEATTPGFLGAGNVLCPFMPIECYSGWLQDGSFGGPAAEGVNMYNSNGQQVCTWRNLIGGTQYGDVFPVVFSAVCGSKSVAWIWKYAENRVLETIGDSIGDTAMRNLITQYRARLALYDLAGWDRGYRQLADNHFGVTVKQEWEPYWIKVEPYALTPYQSVTRNSADGWMAPDTLTNPGWSGANNIPIHVKSGAPFAEVEFRPEDTQMRALLCYRTPAGKCYYSQPVACGKMRIDLTDKPANGVIFCVVVNTDYRFENGGDYRFSVSANGSYGEQLRKHHWDYRIRLGENALAIADTHLKWYFYEKTVKDSGYDEAAILTGVKSIPQAPAEARGSEASVKIVSSLFRAGHDIRLQLDGVEPSDVQVHMIGLSGIVVDAAPLRSDGTYTMPASLTPGLYFVKFTHHGKADTYKVIVK